MSIMRKLLKIISLFSLLVLFSGPALHAAGVASADVSHWCMRVGTLLWFGTAPFWIRAR